MEKLSFTLKIENISEETNRLSKFIQAKLDGENNDGSEQLDPLERSKLFRNSFVYSPENYNYIKIS